MSVEPGYASFIDFPFNNTEICKIIEVLKTLSIHDWSLNINLLTYLITLKFAKSLKF